MLVSKGEARHKIAQMLVDLFTSLHNYHAVLFALLSKRSVSVLRIEASELRHGVWESRIFNRESSPSPRVEERIDSAYTTVSSSSSIFFSRDFHFRSILTTVKRKRREGGGQVFLARSVETTLIGWEERNNGGRGRERLVLSPAASVHARVTAGNGWGRAGKKWTAMINTWKGMAVCFIRLSCALHCFSRYRGKGIGEINLWRDLCRSVSWTGLKSWESESFLRDL